MKVIVFHLISVFSVIGTWTFDAISHVVFHIIPVYFTQVTQRHTSVSAVGDLLSSWCLFDVITDFYWCPCILGQLCTTWKFSKKVGNYKCTFSFQFVLNTTALLPKLHFSTPSCCEIMSCCLSPMFSFLCTTQPLQSNSQWPAVKQKSATLLN